MKHSLLLSVLQFLSLAAAAQVPTLANISAPATRWAVPEVVSDAMDGRPLYWLARSFHQQRPAWVSQHDDMSPNVTLHRLSYNAAGKVTLLTSGDSLTGQLTRRQVSTYDASNRLVGVVDERWWTPSPSTTPPSVTNTHAYAYDSHGNLARTESTNGTDTFVYENSYTYDAAGTITSLTRYAQTPGQARQPVGRITFTLLNGRWQSSTQEEYLNGAWALRQQTHRYNWRDWPRRQLHGSSSTSYYSTMPQQNRDTLRYTASGTDTLIVRLGEYLIPNQGWTPAATSRRLRFDAQHNVLMATDMSFDLDSSALHYDTRHRVLRQNRYHQEINPATISHNYTAYYGPSVVTSTPRPSAQLPLTLSPNPATRQLTLTVPALPDSAPVEADILNALGQVVARRTLRPRAGALLETWDVQGYPAGLYVLRLRTAQGTTAQRFLKQ